MTNTATIPDGWQRVKLGDLIENNFCKLKNNLRKPLSSTFRNTIKGNFPYYGAAGQIDSINDYKLEGFHLLVAEDGTITSDGKKPMLQLVDGKFWVSNHAHILQGKSKKDTLVLYYLLSNVDINQYITGAVQPKLSKTNLLKIKILLPPLPEQEAIAGVLGSLDDKIDLLHRQNQTLEDLAQTLFRHHFTTNPDKHNWEVGKLGDYVETLGGGTPSTTKKEYWEGGNIQWFSPTDLTSNHGMFTFSSAKKITNLGLEKSSAKMFPAFSIMLTSRATVGVISINIEPATTNQGFITLIPNNVYPFEYLYFWLKDKVNVIKMMATGSTFPEISKTVFRNFDFHLPDKETLDNFCVISENLTKKIFSNQSQIRTLEKLRDTLLPKLMSGEVRVKYDYDCKGKAMCLPNKHRERTHWSDT